MESSRIKAVISTAPAEFLANTVNRGFTKIVLMHGHGVLLYSTCEYMKISILSFYRNVYNNDPNKEGEVLKHLDMISVYRILDVLDKKRSCRGDSLEGQSHHLSTQVIMNGNTNALSDVGPQIHRQVSHHRHAQMLSVEDVINVVDDSICFPFVKGVDDQPNILVLDTPLFDCDIKDTTSIISLPVVFEDELRGIQQKHIQRFMDKCDVIYNQNEEDISNGPYNVSSNLHFKCKPGDVIGAGRNLCSTDNPSGYVLISSLCEAESSRVWIAERLPFKGEERNRPLSPPLVVIKIFKRGIIFEDRMNFEKSIIEYLTTEIGELCEVRYNTSKNVISLLDHFMEPVVSNEDISGLSGNDRCDSELLHGCLVFEWLGSSLDSLIQMTNFTGVNPNVVKRLVRNIFRIAALLSEKGIIHTDLKPRNLLLANPGILSHDVIRRTIVTTNSNISPVESLPSVPVFRRVFDAYPMINNGDAGAYTSDLSNNSPKHSSNGSSPCIGPFDPYYIDEDPLRLVIIDFGLSCFVPLELRVPLSFTHPNHSWLVSKVTTAIDDEESTKSTVLMNNGPSDWELQRGRWENGTCGAVDDPISPYTQKQQMLLELSNYTKGAMIQISREYRSPEIILGRDYNSRADVWSAACVTYELITGKCLFDSGPYFPDCGVEDDISSETTKQHHLMEDIIHLQLISQVIGPCKLLKHNKGIHEDLYYVANENTNKLEFLYRYTPIGSMIPAGEQDTENTITRRSLLKELVPYLGVNDARLCSDFLLKCLSWDANDRLSPHSLLNHPWLKGA